MSTKRAYGTGTLLEKHGAWYGRFRLPDGRRLSRRIGPVRPPGTDAGLTRRQAEAELRRLMLAEERNPTPLLGLLLRPERDEPYVVGLPDLLKRPADARSRASPLPPSGDFSKAVMTMLIVRLLWFEAYAVGLRRRWNLIGHCDSSFVRVKSPCAGVHRVAPAQAADTSREVSRIASGSGCRRLQVICMGRPPWWLT